MPSIVWQSTHPDPEPELDPDPELEPDPEEGFNYYSSHVESG